MSRHNSAIVAATLILGCARAALADPAFIEITSALVAPDNTATVDVILHSNGNAVAGMNNDILFDTRAVNLASPGRCTIGPEIGLTAPGCKEDPPVGLCLSLNRNVINCGEHPLSFSCVGQPAYVSLVRAIVYDFMVQRDLPDGAILYRCVFDVVDRNALPTLLKQAGLVVADRVGNRLESLGGDGQIGLDPAAPATWTPAATPTPAPDGYPCNTNAQCANGACVLGTCAASTPTPSDVCITDDDCDGGLHCNSIEGGVCCDHSECPAGTTCRLPGYEGVCSAAPTPTATPLGPQRVTVYYDVTEPDDAGRSVVTARLEGAGVGGVQSDIVFDSRALRPVGGKCRVNPEIGDQQEGCADYPLRLPCLSLITHVANCGETPWVPGCETRAAHESRLRAIMRQVDVSNETALPSSVELYKCTFEVIDASLLPSQIEITQMVAESPFADHIDVDVHAMSPSGGESSNILMVQAPAAPIANSGGGNDGCAIAENSGGRGPWALVAGMLLGLYFRRRQRSRAHR